MIIKLRRARNAENAELFLTISVKRNKKIAPNAVVSECSVCYRVVAY